jgi:ABC-type sugar transport system permease subunit
MPTIAFVTIIMTLSSLMMFTETFVMPDSTGHGGYAQPIGGPNYATHTVVYNIYNQAFDRHREGYASAIAAVFFCVMVLIGAAQFRYLRAKFEY